MKGPYDVLEQSILICKFVLNFYRFNLKSFTKISTEFYLWNQPKQ